MKKYGLFFFLLVALLSLPIQAFAQGSLLKGKMITQEGTIQGLLSACTGQTCIPGQEDIVAAAEDQFVLSTGKNTYYYLPNLKSSHLSRLIGKAVKVKGVEALGGGAIIVSSAQVMENGKWQTFYGPEIMEKVEKLREGVPAFY